MAWLLASRWKPVSLNLPVVLPKLQAMPAALVVTPTANTPPTELVTAYVWVVVGAEPHAKMVVGPLIATVGFPWTVNVVVLGALVVHPALSIAVRVTPNPDGHPTAGLWQVTVT